MDGNLDLVLQSADNEEILTRMLGEMIPDGGSSSRKEAPDARRLSAGVSLLCRLLSGEGKCTVPVLDLVATLPDHESHKSVGVHLASYMGRGSDDEWYLEFLSNEYDIEGRGSLLAHAEFGKRVGKASIWMASEQTEGKYLHRAKTYRVTKTDRFPPKRMKNRVSLQDRLAEYAGPLLGNFPTPAAVLWICFGPSGANSTTWAGSLFAVLCTTTVGELSLSNIKDTTEEVYSALSAAFQRTIVERMIRAEASRQLQLTYFTFGHELKNRIDAIYGSTVNPLRAKIIEQASDLLPDFDRCYLLWQEIGGIAGVFTAVGKTHDGLLPYGWRGEQKGPLERSQANREAIAKALRKAVAYYIYLQDTVKKGAQPLSVRYLDGESLVPLARPRHFRAPVIPPFGKNVPEGSLCLLAGLAELCRNAARATPDIRSSTGPRPPIDVVIHVTEDLVATVLLYNAAVNKDWTSDSVKLLQDLFIRLGDGIKIGTPKNISQYKYAVGDNLYVESRFVYAPREFKYEE